MPSSELSVRLLLPRRINTWKGGTLLASRPHSQRGADPFRAPPCRRPSARLRCPSGAGTLGNECPFFFKRQTQRTLPPGALETAPLCGARSRDDQTDHQASCDSFGPDLGGLVRGYGHALRVFSAGKRPEASRVAQMVRATLSGARKRGRTSGSRGDKASSSGAAGGPPRPAMPSGRTWLTSLRVGRRAHPRRTCGADLQNRACAEDQFPCTAGLCRKQSLAASALVGLPPPTKMECRHGTRGRKHGGFMQSGEGSQQARIAFGLNDAAV